MLIYVDGEEHEFPAGATVLEVAYDLGFDRNGVVVAIDGTVIRRKDWRSNVLTGGMWVEVLAVPPGG